MLYESKFEDSVFKTATVYLDTADGKTYTMNLKLMNELYACNDYSGEIEYVQPGAAIFAEFAQTEVTRVRVTVPVEKRSIASRDFRNPYTRFGGGQIT